eukprot:1158892-Pelagomonas_calceolata.AAC.19
MQGRLPACPLSHQCARWKQKHRHACAHAHTHTHTHTRTWCLAYLQTANEFKTVCPSLNVVSVYGGTSISMQISDLRRGADVVVGTPGRVIDLIERGSLSLDKVRVLLGRPQVTVMLPLPASAVHGCGEGVGSSTAVHARVTCSAHGKNIAL